MVPDRNDDIDPRLLDPTYNDPSTNYTQASSPFGDLSPSWTTGYDASSADSNFQSFDNNQAMAIDALDWVRDITMFPPS